MKRIELLFSAILVPVDYLMIVLAGLAAHALRFHPSVREVFPVVDDLALSVFFPALLVAALGWLVIFALSGLYAIRGTRRFLDEFTSIFLACSTGFMAVVVLFFFQRELFSSRFIILTGWVVAIVFVAIGRMVVRAVQRSLLQKNIGVYRVLVIGNDRTTNRLLELFRSNPGLGFRMVEQHPTADNSTLAVLEARLQENGHNKPFDMLLQADPTLPREQTQALIEYANDHHLTFRYAADLLEAQATNIAVETLAGIPVIEIKRTKLDGWGRIAKRIMDIVVSVFILIITLPILLLTTLFIRLDTPGPILFRSRRLGERGNPFDLYKFRSMVQNAHAMKPQLMHLNERNGPLFKIKNDPRVTRVGRFLRRSSIDELPQLLNVLKGEMSIVGPRPHEPEEVARYERHHRKLLTIKPGITGLAQVSGRSDLDFAEEARLDIFYIENWSMRLDWVILFRTPMVVLRMKSAS
ncbi:MAG: sugar transferase [Candidatus Kerfeldbacteria bacterium]|nr:sugar transferase [Candidatus Kerfeldbacteria bacterium]